MSWDDQDFGGGGPDLPDPKEVLRKMKDKFNPAVTGGVFGAIVLVLVGLWGSTGAYTVDTAEVGVITRFGKYVEKTGPGLHWHLPFPIESVEKVNVQEFKRLEVGFETVSVGPPATYRKIPEQSHMLTGDENIVSTEFIVQYRVSDAYNYLFKVHNPEELVRNASEAAMREVVGRNQVDDVLTEAKDKIQVEARDMMQSILDEFESGIYVSNVKLQDVYPPSQVIAAFRDVASAREDRETFKNNAEAYANDILPKARGEAEKRINDAEGYRARVTKQAEGDAARFVSIYNEYKLARDVTRKRLYLETMQDVLSNSRVVLTDDGKGSVLPVLPLGNLTGGEAKK